MIAEDNGKVVRTCIANYDVQLSYIRFLIKEGYESVGIELLKEMEKRLRKRGTLAMFIVPRKGKPCERSLKAIKLEGLNKYANCEFWVKFLNKKEDFPPLVIGADATLAKNLRLTARLRFAPLVIKIFIDILTF